MPPSPHPSGARYEWVAGLAPWEAPVAQAPEWLLDLVSPVWPPTRSRTVPKYLFWEFPSSGIDTRYVAAAMRTELFAVANAQEGTRNTTLNRAAYSLARFVLGGPVAAHDLAQELAWAASRAGLCEDEIGRTIHSAFKARGVLG